MKMSKLPLAVDDGRITKYRLIVNDFVAVFGGILCIAMCCVVSSIYYTPTTISTTSAATTPAPPSTTGQHRYRYPSLSALSSCLLSVFYCSFDYNFTFLSRVFAFLSTLCSSTLLTMNGLIVLMCR